MTKNDLQVQLEQVGDSIAEMLNPRLSREQIVEKLVDLDDTINGVDDEDLSESDDDDEDDDHE